MFERVVIKIETLAQFAAALILLRAPDKEEISQGHSISKGSSDVGGGNSRPNASNGRSPSGN
jgi:hypothetical protein